MDYDDIPIPSTAADHDHRILIDSLCNSTAPADDDHRILDDTLHNSTAAADDHRLLEDTLPLSTAASKVDCIVDDTLSDSTDDDDRLLDDINCHTNVASSNDDCLLIDIRSKATASSSSAYAPAQFFDRNSTQLPLSQSPSPHLPPYWTEGPKVNWLCLPQEVLATILLKLGALEIIESAQKVCTLWRSVSLDPSLWTRIDMGKDSEHYKWYCDLALMCRHAVNRSGGGCVDISIEYFGDDYLLNYIINSGCQLRRLRLVCCLSVSDEGMVEAAPRLPFLETFEYYMGNLAESALKAIGKNCPRLTTLRNEQEGCMPYGREMDDEAFAIAKYMPGLRSLSLVGIKLTDTGLGAILDGCPHLESLDLRQCFNVNLKGDNLVKKCERIKELKLPGDSIAGYEFRESIMRFHCEVNYNMDKYSEYDYLDDSSDYSDYNPGSNTEDYSLDHADYYDF